MERPGGVHGGVVHGAGGDGLAGRGDYRSPHHFGICEWASRGDRWTFFFTFGELGSMLVIQNWFIVLIDVDVLFTSGWERGWEFDYKFILVTKVIAG